MRATFQGSIVALVTPFRGGKVDEAKLRELVEWHVASGTDGIVPCGTTGESPTLSHDEHRRVVELIIETARGRVAVIAGTGSNSTSEAIDLTRHARKAGATAALAGDWKQARELHLKLFPLSRAMFIETNPIPVKEALAMMGKLAEPEFRLPMCRMGEANRPKLRAVLASLGLAKG